MAEEQKKVANLIVADIETSGFSPYVNAITEIALICIDSITLKEIDRYEAVIAPYKNKQGECKYEQAALDYSGMTMAKINAGKDAKEVANDLEAFFQKHNKKMRFGVGKPILCGHNFLKFDKPHIDHFMWLHGKVNIKQQVLDEKKGVFIADYEETLYQKETFDTLNWARQKYAVEEIADNKLPTVCEWENIPLMDAHRAMNDTEGNAKLMIKYIQNLRSGSSEIKKENRVRDTFKF